MDGRAARGRVLAKAQPERIKEIEPGLWFVPSQKAGGYLVNVEMGTCSCADHTGHKVKCKHIWAVEYAQTALVNVADGAQAVAVPAKALPPKGDLTVQEQGHVRDALRFLRTRAGGMNALAKAIRAKPSSLNNHASARFRRAPTAGLAVRLARHAGVPVDDVISGRFPPPGLCAHCGRGTEPTTPAT